MRDLELSSVGSTPDPTVALWPAPWRFEACSLQPISPTSVPMMTPIRMVRRSRAFMYCYKAVIEPTFINRSVMYFRYLGTASAAPTVDPRTTVAAARQQPGGAQLAGSAVAQARAAGTAAASSDVVTGTP